MPEVNELAAAIERTFNTMDNFLPVKGESWETCFKRRLLEELSYELRQRPDDAVVEALRRELELNIGTLQEQARRCERWGKSHHELDSAIEQSRKRIATLSQKDKGRE
jgi:hypothetical protein